MAVQNLYVRESSDTTTWADKDSSLIYNTIDDAFNAVTTNNSDGAVIYIGGGTWTLGKPIIWYGVSGTPITFIGKGAETKLNLYEKPVYNTNAIPGKVTWVDMYMDLKTPQDSNYGIGPGTDSYVTNPIYLYNIYLIDNNSGIATFVCHYHGNSLANYLYCYNCSFYAPNRQRLVQSGWQLFDCAYQAKALKNNGAASNCIASTFDSDYHASPDDTVGVYGGEYSWNPNIVSLNYYDDDRSTILKTTRVDKTALPTHIWAKEVNWQLVEDESARIINAYPGAKGGSGLGVKTITKFVRTR